MSLVVIMDLYYRLDGVDESVIGIVIRVGM